MDPAHEETWNAEVTIAKNTNQRSLDSIVALLDDCSAKCNAIGPDAEMECCVRTREQHERDMQTYTDRKSKLEAHVARIAARASDQLSADELAAANAACALGNKSLIRGLIRNNTNLVQWKTMLDASLAQAVDAEVAGPSLGETIAHMMDEESLNKK